jgi:hypothetical protein
MTSSTSGTRVIADRRRNANQSKEVNPNIFKGEIREKGDPEEKPN